MAIRPLDKYSVKARLVPALVVLLPVALSIASIFPGKFAGWDVIVWLGTSSGLAVFLEQLARDMGKKKEPGLFEGWGGKPTTVMLRHSTSPLGPVTLARYHRKLASLVNGISLPSAEEEARDPGAADQIYESCSSYLRAATRNRDEFPLVFEENTNYGFRRNLWGMKPIGITLALASVAVVLTQIHPNWIRPGMVEPVVFAALILDASFLLIWFKLITPDWIKVAADAYAMQLLTACDKL